MKPPYLIVSGDFVKAGGMNQPNYELARYLADEGFETHLVGYRVADDLARHPGVTCPSRAQGGQFIFSLAATDEPARSALGARDRGGRWPSDRQRRLLRLGRHQLGSSRAGGLRAAGHGGMGTPAKESRAAPVDLAAERRIVPRAKLAITDTERMKHDIVERLGFPAERAHAVYLGIDPALFRPPTADERAAARARNRRAAAPIWRLGARWSLSSARSATLARASTRSLVPGPRSARNRPGMRTWWWWRRAASYRHGRRARQAPE